MARKFKVAIDMDGNKVTNAGDPTSAQDLATKAYVDAVKSGLDVKDSVRAATTANVTIAGPGAAIDGVTLVNGDRVLVKDQSTGSQNGIYIFNGSGSAMTRATDADANAEVTGGLYVFVEEGTVNADTGWVLITNNPITVGTTALSFTQFTGVGSLIAGAGLTKTGTTVDVVSNHAFIVVNADNIDIGTLPVNKGGTGATDAATARTNLGATTKFSTATHASTTAIAVTHNLNSTSVHCQVYDVASGALEECDVVITDANTVTFTFAVAPTANSKRFVIIA